MLTKKEIFDLFGNYNYQFAVVRFLVDCKGRVFLWLINGKNEFHTLKKIKQRKKYPYLARLRFSIFNLLETLEPENEALTVYARKVRQKARCHPQDQYLKQKCEDKPMHGQYQKE